MPRSLRFLAFAGLALTVALPVLASDPAPATEPVDVAEIEALPEQPVQTPEAVTTSVDSSASGSAQLAPAPPPSLEALLEPLTEDRLFRDSTVALQVVDVRSGQEVYAWNADAALNPASTMKVVTAATALRELGPSHKFQTEFFTDGDIQPDGTLKGNLYVVGGGDPGLVIEDLWKMVYDLKLEGVDSIQGNIVFDGSYMTAESGVPGWDKKIDRENGPAYYPSLGALSLNFNTVGVVAGPGPDIGGPARVVLETPAPGVVEIENELVTGAPGTRRRIYMEREVKGRKMTLKLSGSIPQKSQAQKYYRSVPDAQAYFTAAFAGLMKERGIRVRGKYLEGELPERGVDLLVRHRSQSLSQILASTNKHSNNFMAEQVLKALGAELEGEGSTEAGLRVVQAYLDELGIPAEEYALVNGSGLSREILIRPTHINAVLVDMMSDPQVGHEFLASLAIGGRDGTLWARFRDEDQVGKLRGKTGTLNGVHCLAGYVEAADGSLYAFTFLVNDLPYSIARARQAHDRFADVMFDVGADALVAEAGAESSD